MSIFESNLLLIGTIAVLAVVSPGPDFAIIFRNGLRYGRRVGLVTALGIASGVVVHTTYALLGLSYIVAEYVWVLEFVRYAGAGYLIWLGVSAFKPPKKQEGNNAEDGPVLLSLGTSFRQGFFCNVLNPKTMLFFIALFTQVITPSTSLGLKIGIGAFISLIHLIWFMFVVFVVTNNNTQKLVKNWRNVLEKVVGVCLLGLGAKLALDV
ncbi:LysE family translocator [Maridesulfovibrio sp.]|uniref:LysE family translocator n=1 Tax=Maridesulfovibrio sp. TaxID=2795000 RepID=UPI0029CA681E|nr:LysE family translocator [Maridesulfovibrio sp.]